MAIIIGKYKYAIRNNTFKDKGVSRCEVIYLTQDFASRIVVVMDEQDLKGISKNFTWLGKLSLIHEQERDQNLSEIPGERTAITKLEPQRKLFNKKEIKSLQS